jgi:hypothetical protein
VSIRNDATGRHEDDLMDEAYQNGGKVTVVHLVEHLEEIVGLPNTFGSNVADSARTAAYLLRKLGLEGKLDLYSETELLSPRR